MPFRFQFTKPFVVECDNADEVLDLAEAAMQRAPQSALIESPEITDDAGEPTQKPKPRRITREPKPTQPRAHRGGIRSHVKAVVAWMKGAASGARASTIARLCEIPDDVIGDVLDAAEFERYGKGFYRLADQDDREPEPAPTSSGDDGDEDFHEDPPRKAPSKPAANHPWRSKQPTSLESKIVDLITKEGPLSLATIALAVDASRKATREALRGNPETFTLHPRAGGWKLA